MSRLGTDIKMVEYIAAYLSNFVFSAIHSNVSNP